MTTADLKTGDIVQHPEKGRGYVLRHGEGGSVRVIYASQARTLGFDLDLDTDGWERAEIVKPGHVQVRVDDLDPQTLSEWSQWADHNIVETVLLRVGCASIARQVGQGDPTADEPTETTVTRNLGGRVGLFRHPDVPGDMQHCDLNGDEWRRAGCLVDMTNHFVLDHGDWFETICPDGTVTPQPADEPAQPDEPTGLGAVVEVGGKRFVRTDEDGHPWIDNVAYWHTWDEITARGLVAVLSEGLAS